MVAVTEQDPLASVIESVVPALEQPVEAPALNITAPVPLPPVVLRVAVPPYARFAGAVMSRSVAWFALASVTG